MCSSAYASRVRQGSSRKIVRRGIVENPAGQVDKVMLTCGYSATSRTSNHHLSLDSGFVNTNLALHLITL